MNRKQKIYLAIAIFLFVGGIALSHTYRPYVYANDIADWGLADTIGSLVSVMAAACFFWSFKEYAYKQKQKQILLITFTFAISWELAGWIGLHGTFDAKDMLAATLSGVFTWLLLYAMEGRSEEATEREEN